MIRFSTLITILYMVCLVGAVGCGSKCSDLDEICKKCTDPKTKGGCMSVVATDDEAYCESVLKSISCR